MTTREMTIDRSKYWLITQDADFIIQNTNSSFVQIVASDTAPAVDTNGINLREGDAITQQHINGTIWALGDATLVVGDSTGELPQP